MCMNVTSDLTFDLWKYVFSGTPIFKKWPKFILKHFYHNFYDFVCSWLVIHFIIVYGHMEVQIAPWVARSTYFFFFFYF